MSTALTYGDLSRAEQAAYDVCLRQYLKASDAKARLLADGTAQRADTAEAAMKRLRPPYHRNLWAAVRVAYCYAKIGLTTRRYTQASTRLETLIRTYAQQRGCPAFVRESFPQFPADLEPWPTLAADVSTAPTYPAALQQIIATFRAAAPDERLRLLLGYAQSLPALPAELHNARDSMEHVLECQAPVFLLAQLHEGKVHYYIDVPQEAPTVRGFAGLLHQGLHGATPAEIAAMPRDLDVQLDLQKVLSPIRLIGLTALASRMQHNARELAVTVSKRDS